MNMSDLLQLGATVFQKSKLSGDAGSNVDLSAIAAAFGGLTGGKEGFDLTALIKNLNGGGLGEIASSWLGDGANAGVSPDQVTKALGPDTIAEFASKLGLSEDEASGGLSEALPHMVDKASSGGSLLDSLGGVEGLVGLAGKLFK